MGGGAYPRDLGCCRVNDQHASSVCDKDAEASWAKSTWTAAAAAVVTALGKGRA